MGAPGRRWEIGIDQFCAPRQPRRRLLRPSDAPLELVLRTLDGSVAGLGANAPTGSGHLAEVGSWEAVRSSGEHEVVEA